jgi:hypothetical protein
LTRFPGAPGNPRRPCRRGVAGMASVILLLVVPPGTAQTIDESLWVADGPVSAVVVSGGTVYIGGAFGYVGPSTGGAVPLDATSGALPSSFPKVAGIVKVVAPDGQGGWYIAGVFTQVGGAPARTWHTWRLTSRSRPGIRMPTTRSMPWS